VAHSRLQTIVYNQLVIDKKPGTLTSYIFLPFLTPAVIPTDDPHHLGDLVRLKSAGWLPLAAFSHGTDTPPSQPSHMDMHNDIHTQVHSVSFQAANTQA